MNNRTDSFSAELGRSARMRVRLPDAMASTRLFQGWGPTV
jgi:hypothetical protein